MPSLLQRAVAPSSHSIFRAFFPWNAAHVFSATTATPLEIWTTRCTPRTARAGAASKLFTRPPNTGQRATAAYTMPGTRTSQPKTAWPLTLSGVSTRGIRFPRMRNSEGALSGGSAGTGSVAARGARSP